jgi:hypothetical protein
MLYNGFVVFFIYIFYVWVTITHHKNPLFIQNQFAMKKTSIKNILTKKAANGIIYLLILFVLSSLYTSCSKGSSGSSGTSNVTLLTSASWKLQKYEYQKSGAWIADPDPKSMSAITISFSTNNSFLEITGTSNSQSTGTWAISSDNTQFTVTGGTFPAIYTLNQLDQSTLVITYVTYTFTATGYTNERKTFTH